MYRRFFGLISAVTVGALLGLFIWSTYSVVVLNRADIYAENGLLENIQAILLGMACIVFLAPSALEKRSDKLILFACSLLCLAFMLRELDIETLDVHDTLKFIGAGAGRNAIIAAGVIVLISYGAFWFSYYKKRAADFIRSRAGVLLMMGAVLIIIGDAFEKYDWIGYHVYVEEIFELFGYAFMLLAAFAI